MPNRSASRRRRSWGQRLVILIPYLWLVAFFLVPFLIVLKISLSQTRDRAAALHAGARSQPQAVQGLRDFFAGLSFDELRAARLATGSISPPICEPRRSRALSTAILLLIGFPIAYGMARAPRALAGRAVHAGGAAVLDLVPDPHLCLDQHPAARRPAQPGAARARHRRCAAGLALRPTPRSSSASSIPICRSWCCRSTPRSRRWTRRCSKPPPISAARAGRRSGWSRCRCRLPGIVAGALLCFIPIVGEFVIPDLLGGSGAMMIGQTLWTRVLQQQGLAGRVGGRGRAARASCSCRS